MTSLIIEQLIASAAGAIDQGVMCIIINKVTSPHPRRPHIYKQHNHNARLTFPPFLEKVTSWCVWHKAWPWQLVPHVPYCSQVLTLAYFSYAIYIKQGVFLEATKSMPPLLFSVKSYILIGSRDASECPRHNMTASRVSIFMTLWRRFICVVGGGAHPADGSSTSPQFMYHLELQTYHRRSFHNHGEEKALIKTLC